MSSCTYAASSSPCLTCFVVIGTVCVFEVLFKESRGVDAGEGSGSVVFLVKLLRRQSSRQRREHFLGGRVAGSATEKKSGKVVFIVIHILF